MSIENITGSVSTVRSTYVLFAASPSCVGESRFVILLLFRLTSPPTSIDNPVPAPGLVITPAFDTLTLAVPPVPMLSVSSTPRFLILLLITPAPSVSADSTSLLLIL